MDHPRENLFFGVCTCRCNVNWRSVIMYYIIYYNAINDFLRISKFTVLLTVLLFCSFPANNFNISKYTRPHPHMVESISSLSCLELGSSPASSSNGCFSRFTEAGVTSATYLLTSLGEAGAFHPPVFLASRRCKSCSFLNWSFSRLQHPWIWFMSRLIPFGFRELNFCKISSQGFAFFLNVLLS